MFFNQSHKVWETGSHFFFGIMEAFGHGCVKRVRADITYADGEGGTQAETAASGEMELESGLVIELDVRTDSAVGDVYELVRLTPPSVLRTTTKPKARRCIHSRADSFFRCARRWLARRAR